MDIRINPINFTAKYKNIDTKPIKKITAAVSTTGLSLAGLNATDQSDIKKPISPDYYMDIKANKIKRAISKRIKNNTTLTIKELAKKTKIPENQVVTILYRCNRYPELREMFDQVKDGSHLLKPLDDSDYGAAKNIVSKAAVYNITDTDDTNSDADINTVIGANEDYIKNLARNIKKALTSRTINKDSLKVFCDNFEELPAFADIIITAKAPNIDRIRTIGSAENMQMLFDAYRLNPEITEETVTALNKEGKFKYSTNEIYKIAYVTSIFPELSEEVKTDPKTIYWLTSLENEYNNQRFWSGEIKELYGWYKKYPAVTNKFINEFYVTDQYKYNPDAEDKKDTEEDTQITNESTGEDDNKKGKYTRITRPRFNGEQLLYLLEMYDVYPDIVMYLDNYKSAYFRSNSDLIIKALNDFDICNNAGLHWRFDEIDNKKELKKLKKPKKLQN